MGLDTAGIALSGSQVGTAANRPAASAVPVGFLYYATDTNALSESNGSAWTQVVAGNPSASALGRTFISRATAVGGDITTNHITTYAELAAATGGPGTGGFDLTIAAVAGDVLYVTGSFMFNDVAAVSVFIDVATWVSGAAVTWIGQTAGGNAASPWGAGGGVVATAPLAQLYTVVSGDITGGNVVLRTHYLSGAATNRRLSRSTANGAMALGVINFKQ